MNNAYPPGSATLLNCRSAGAGAAGGGEAAHHHDPRPGETEGGAGQLLFVSVSPRSLLRQTVM